MNNRFTDWLVNLSWLQMLAIVLILLVIRYLLLRRTSKISKALADTAEMLATAGGLIFLVVFPFLIQPFFIPSESMVPTFRKDDRIFVNKAVYRMRDPKRGDIIVFKAPPSAVEMGSRPGMPMPKDVRYIKRVIAVPGDVVRVTPGYVAFDGMKLDHTDLRRLLTDASPFSDGQVKLIDGGACVNGNRLTAAEVASKLGTRSQISIKPGKVILNGKALGESYTEEDPDAQYPDPRDLKCWKNVIDAESEGKVSLVGSKETLSVRLGKGEYLVMGDNRNDSQDGRFWGPLDRNRILGRAMFVWWPFNRLHWAR